MVATGGRHNLWSEPARLTGCRTKTILRIMTDLESTRQPGCQIYNPQSLHAKLVSVTSFPGERQWQTPAQIQAVGSSST